MKHSFKVFGAIAMMLLMSACGKEGQSYTNLQNSYDSLLVQNTRNQQELESVLSLIMDVENEIQKVAVAENKVRVGQLTGELSESARDQLLMDIKDMTATLEKNKEELARQMDQLKRKDINISALNKKITTLQQQIVEKENTIAELTRELASRDLRIQEQQGQIEDLSETTGVQETTIALQDKKLAHQDAKLHTGYYCFGTVSELKEQNILSGGGLFSRTKVLPDGFNKDYFIRIDTRQLTTIQLLAPRAWLRTEHPTSSYDLVKDSDGNMVLHITDTENFWSRSKYLVVEVAL